MLAVQVRLTEGAAIKLSLRERVIPNRRRIGTDENDLARLGSRAVDRAGSRAGPVPSVAVLDKIVGAKAKRVGMQLPMKYVLFNNKRWLSAE